MKKLILSILLLAGAVSAFAQYPARRMMVRHYDYGREFQPYGPPGEVVTVRGGMFNQFYMNGWEVGNDYMMYLMTRNPNPATAEAMRRANVNGRWAAATVWTGISCTLFGLVSLPFVFDDDIDDHGFRNAAFIVGGVGVGLILVTIPLARGYNRHSERAVNLYNAGMGLSSSYEKRRPEWSLVGAGNGIGLTMKF